MIIIEGPDGGSKSTICEYLKTHSDIGVIKPFYPKQHQLSYYLYSGPHYALSYLERYYISELVYPQFKKDRTKMSPWHQYLIEASLSPFAPVILYARPDSETIKENIRRRGDDYIDENETDQMLFHYDNVMEKTVFPVFRYNYKEDDLEDVILDVERIHRQRQERCRALQQFLSSGDYYTENGIMIIGEAPSNSSISNGFIRAFISDTGSPEFLHKCLYDIGLYPGKMPYFTNWNKHEDNEKLNKESLLKEIELLKPQKIVCLGEKIKEKSGIENSISVYHPSFIKRFGMKNYENYLEDLKNKLL